MDTQSINAFEKYNRYVIDRFAECGALQDAITWLWIDLADREKGVY
jgi:hypothetical protein